MNVGVQLIGLDALRGKLKSSNITPAINSGIKKATLLLDREVKQATVVDTGRLRSSITSKLVSDSGQVGTNVEYAHAVEYGKGRMESRHMEGAAKILGKGMFAYGIEQMRGKMKGILGDVAKDIEARWR